MYVVYILLNVVQIAQINRGLHIYIVF